MFNRIAITTTLCLAACAPAAADDLASLSDDFSVAGSTADWSRRYLDEAGQEQLERWEINPADAPGQMLMMPHTTTWYQSYRGPLVYKNVTGDFALTTSVTVSNRAGTGVPATQYSLAGVMLRVPPAAVGLPENYVFLSIGHGTGGAAQFEVKTTMEGTSRLVLDPAESLTTHLQLARVGDRIFTLYKRPQDAEWIVHRVYDADSADPFFDHNLGTGALQAGFVTYTNWEKASTFDPAYQSLNTLTEDDNTESSNAAEPFNPDLIARFDFAHFQRLDVPGGFADDATDADYLAVLGGNAVPEPAMLGTVALAGGVLLLRRRRAAA